MRPIVLNAQRALPVETRKMARVARCAIKRLRIRARGTCEIAFVTAARIHALHRAFLGHDGPTDVLSFRYDGEPVVGEILIAPSAARAYARRHGVAYEEELRRYVVHGLLHWLGHEDRTKQEQARMRALEDDLLAHCT